MTSPLRNIFLVGNFGPCEREIADKKLGRPVAVTVRAVILGVPVAFGDTDVRGVVTSSNGQVSYSEYTSGTLEQIDLLLEVNK